MKFTAVILVIAVSAVAHGATVRYDGKDSKKNPVSGDFPVTKPTIVETSSRSSQEDMHLAQIQMQANQIENSRIHNNNKYAYQSEVATPQAYHGQDPYSTDSPAAQEFQRDQVIFHSQQSPAPATTLSSNDQFDDQYSYQPEAYNDQAAGNNQQFFNMEQQQFYGDKEQASAEQQHFFNKQQEANQDQFYGSDKQSQEQFFGSNQKAQEQFFGNNQKSQEQFFGNNQKSEEQFFNQQQQSPKQEMFNQDQQFINTMHVVGVEGQKFNSDNPFQGISNHQSTHISTGKHSTQIQTQGVVQLSAFDNREQPLVLPRGSVQSASVVVSGLKNMPVLPAMVYNAGSIPATHAIAYTSDPLYKGASVRQHMQTPYVRYVYSHIL